MNKIRVTESYLKLENATSEINKMIFDFLNQTCHIVA